MRVLALVTACGIIAWISWGFYVIHNAPEPVYSYSYVYEICNGGTLGNCGSKILREEVQDEN